MDISVLVTAHKEGLFLNKTLLSVRNSLSHISSVKTEIILNLDNADTETKRVAKIWQQKDKRIKVYQVSFGNPADNRNDALKKAKGTYVAVVDGDDLVSENWFPGAYRMKIGRAHV